MATWVFCGKVVTVTSGRAKYFQPYHPPAPRPARSTTTTTSVFAELFCGVWKIWAPDVAAYGSAVCAAAEGGTGATVPVWVTGVPHQRQNFCPSLSVALHAAQTSCSARVG